MKSIILASIIFISTLIGTVNAQWQGGPFGKRIGSGSLDSLFVINFSTSAGMYKLWRATISNRSASLTDSVKIYHISKLMIKNGDTVATADTNRIRFKKLNANYTAPQNDTLYDVLALGPLSSVDIVLWFPFPDEVMFEQCNIAYNAARKTEVKARAFNEKPQ